ncbi:stage II sporulation protein M [Paenibacillus nanensis]|uniref:Stage II sporulation protein M n=1 Tax=Paenibacillus nanensis TaxID=393251 RepID=A0A3A1UP09_9BACL|nr:stage II sporulation protein M [Paenibacillus nanensis]RIX47848.1 stage II sporulation protein M [Paenibacillus nanensis]
MFKPSAIIQHFKEMRGYISFSFILFFASIVVGGTNTSFHSFLNGQLEGLGQLVDMVGNNTLLMMLVIFLNNAIKSILIMYLGAFYGVIPFFFIVTNGMVIGYLLEAASNSTSPDALPVWEIIVKGLLPHGIIEIPAIIFACAYGLKFGGLVFRASGSLVFARGKLGGIGKEIEHFAIRTVPMIVILTVALLIASVIESTITTWLLK